jgi:hypothetical protein
LIGAPPWPGNVTSRTSADRIGVSTRASTGWPPGFRAVATSEDQNVAKSSGSATSGRYSRS